MQQSASLWNLTLSSSARAPQDLRQLELEGPGGPVLRRHLVEEFGRLRAITLGPDGYLYVASSNRDTRGNPQAGDDRIVRLELRKTDQN